MASKTLSIIIPALNEEKNILNLLEDIKTQKTPEDCIIETVLVISDGSTDNTNKIVSEFANRNSKIKLHINEKRIGKIHSIAKGYQILNSDYLIMLDADVRLENNTFSELIKNIPSEKTINLFAGNPIPFKPSNSYNFAAQASMFSWHIVQSIKSIQPNSIYSAHGRILMLSNVLYKSINIKSLSTPGDDQFIYLQSKDSFRYVSNAVVYYRLPRTITDYLNQNLRFRRAQQMREEAIPDLKEIFYIKDKFKLVITNALIHPVRFFLWITLYILGKVTYNFEHFFGQRGDSWGVAKSTK